jgi:hypothetical protein
MSLLSFIPKVGVEELIMNHSSVCKNTNNAKSEVRFKLLIPVIRGAFTIESSTPTLRIN